ncbi:MAG: PfkB family carbohydrate kinase [bacterium]|nr:PfkB family carbohydrate kinase [bacterium]
MASKAEFEKTVKDFKWAKVLVIGDLMLDTYLIGEAARISPEAPVPVVKLGRTEDRPGGAANTAMNIAALGGRPIVMGIVGRNYAGKRFMALMKSISLSTEGIISREDITTTRKVRVVAGTQQIVRIDEEDVLQWTEELSLEAAGFIEKSVGEVDAIAISDYAKGFLNGRLMTKLNDVARVRNIPILVDTKPVNIGLYKGCDLLKPNRKEAEELSGVKITDEKSCDHAASVVMNQISPRALLITRGSEGMDLYREGRDVSRIRAHISQVFDVSGAGDTVLATLALSYAGKVDPEIACELASYAAGVAVRKPGTSVVTPEELLESIP